MARGDWPAQEPIQFRAETWKKKLGPAWPDIPEEEVRLGREAVFDVAYAQRRTEATTQQLLGAIGIWGYGKAGRGGYRVQRWLEDERLDSKLDNALESARAGDLADAYGSLCRGSRNHVHGLGPAFFTKLLYFGAYERGQNGVQPLILDRYVALGLGLRTGRAWRTTGWSADQYVSYLGLARQYADAPGGPAEPDLVEFELFDKGRRSARRGK